MRKFLLASHGNLAAGMKNTVEMIAGARENIQAIGAYTKEIPDVKVYMDAYMKNRNEDDELVIITDLLGGSVNNEMAQYRTFPNVYVIAGMNAALVLNLVLGEGSIESLIAESIQAAKEQISYMEKEEASAEEDF